MYGCQKGADSPARANLFTLLSVREATSLKMALQIRFIFLYNYYSFFFGSDGSRIFAHN